LVKDEKGNEFNITGYYTMQFFSGFLIDVIIYINNKLSITLKESATNNSGITLTEEFKNIIHLLLNLVIFVLSVTTKYTKKIKESLQISRKIILIDKISSILSSIEIILSNVLILFCYQFYDNLDIENKLVYISNNLSY
jgi:hypothetical protein